jgi:SWIM zinc finger
LSQCGGRVDKAVAIVLNGDVELQADGTARVASQSNGTTKYFVVNGECSCPDFAKASSGWCKHRIAAGLAKRVAARVKAPLVAPANGQATAAGPPTPVQASPAVPSAPLPEVPAIVSTTITVAGRRVEVKLCDSNDARLLARLTALLAQYPYEPPTGLATAADDTPRCPKHDVVMKLNHGKDGSTWYSHKTADG